ncbi:MAG: glycosyltransferase family 2 protein [Paramuribaculum sp.]|nr:glycosyltransferase family 2 protein [Paramuribaculum sp.]
MDETTDKKIITIILPCYNEEKNISILYRELERVISHFRKYDWELLFINDGSSDLTINEIVKLQIKDENIKYIDLSRNFGKEAAMLAGLDHSIGDAVLIMDADLQHPVDVIPEMIKYWEEGYDDIYGKRLYRGKESWLRRLLTRIFYKILSNTSKIEILPDVGDFRLLDRKCVDALKEMRETERYTKGLYCWIGFKKKEILIRQGERRAGKTAWNLRALFKLALNGITSFSSAPLQLMFTIGILFSFLAFCYLLFILFRTVIYGEPVRGFPTLVILILFLGGVQILCFGVLGLYLSRIFNETKKRPPYIIREKS